MTSAGHTDPTRTGDDGRASADPAEPAEPAEPAGAPAAVAQRAPAPGAGVALHARAHLPLRVRQRPDELTVRLLVGLRLLRRPLLRGLGVQRRLRGARGDQAPDDGALAPPRPARHRSAR